MICKYFEIHELVGKDVYKARGEKAWELLDSRLLVTIDMLRKKFGKMTINNWYWGGDREWSGLRTPESPYYSKTSQHSFGRAADILPQETSVEEIRAYLQTEEGKQEFPYIRGLEDGVSWLHIDVRNTLDDNLKVFKP